MINKLKKITKWQWLTIIFFFIILLIGILTVKDYGICNDEELQRNHSLVNMKFLNNKFGIKNRLNNDNNIASLNDYEYRYYGVAIQMPLVVIEQIFDFNLDISIVYYIRHIYTFLLFFIALIYFYRILSKYIIKDRKIALLGVLFLVLSPRIYGEAFYNIKDSVFLSLTIINIYYALTYLNKKSKKSLLLLCFFSALAINCRIVGGLISLFVILFNNFSKNESISQRVKENLLFILITFIIYTLITPASWGNPFTFPYKVLSFFFNYSDPNSHDNLPCFYLGKVISSRNLPWHYLPVWIIVTTPLIYILSSIVGFFKQVINIKVKKINKSALFCNFILVFMLLFVMMIRPTIYNGWRHFYFLYPLIIINSIIGIKWLFQIKKIKLILNVILFVNCLGLSLWMIINHPYQYEFFELFFSKYTVKNFETGIYSIAQKEAVDYILKTDTHAKIRIYKNQFTSYALLNETKRNRVVDCHDKLLSDYVIITSKYVDKSLKLIFYEKFSKKINGYRYYTIYKKKSIK